ncbi:MAG: NAD-dependent epimerase/dehydratase family protein [Bacillota bacterium]
MQKRALEKVLWGLRGRPPFAFTIARPANIEGPGDPSNRRGFYIQRIADGGPVIIPDGLNPPFRHVYVDDVAQALAAMAGNERTYGRAHNRSTAVRRWVADTVRWFLGPGRGEDSRDYGRRALEVQVAEEYRRKMTEDGLWT